MVIPTATVIGAMYYTVSATFVAHWIINFRCTALVVGGYIVVKFSIATNRSVRIVVNSTATSKTISYIKDVALATNKLSWIVISVTTTA
jgi:hypothetical protein